MGLRMRVFEREPIGVALRRFKKLVERSGIKGELRAREFYEKPIPRRPESVHIVDQLLDVARFLGAPVCAVKFPLAVPPQDDALAAFMLRSHGIDPGRPFVAINPTDGGGHKSWGVDRFVGLVNELARQSRVLVVLVGGWEDRRLGEAIRSRTRPPAADLIGGTSLPQLAAVLRRAALHLSGDTASAHIAAALGTPVISLFGRTDPARLAPYGQEHLAFHRRDQCAAACRRYHDRAPVNSSQKCLVPPPACLAAISVEDVVALARAVLEGTIPTTRTAA